MLTQKKFVNKYLRIHPHVTQKYAIKKYLKGRHSFGIDSLDSDTSYDDIRSFENEDEQLHKLLQKRNINSEHFHNFVQNRKITLHTKSYEDVIKKYLDAIENGDVSPVKSLSPDQRGLIRRHPKCKLYKWMNEIAPNDNIPHHVNILSDKECRYYYMHEGLDTVTINRMLKILIRARKGNAWAINIYPQAVDIIDVANKNEKTQKKIISRNTGQLSGFLNHFSSTKFCTVGIGNHECMFIKHPTDPNTILILNPHGVHADNNIVFDTINRSLDPDVLNKYVFTTYTPDFSDQEFEGSCVSHSLSRMFYIAYNMKNKEYTLDNLVYYFEKQKIPCQYAIFTQNLKYLAEIELNNPGKYESEEHTIMKMNKSYKRKLSRKILFLHEFETENPFQAAIIKNFEEACEKFVQENGHKLSPSHQKFVEFENFIDDIIRALVL